MKGRYLLAFITVLVLLAGNACEAIAQNEVTLLSPSPLREEFEKLIPGFESKTKSRVSATWGTGVSTRNDVAAGKALDVCILYSPFPEALASGNLDRSSARPLVKLRLGVAVKKGAPKADVSTPDNLRRFLLAAKSLTTVDPAQGSVGVAVVEALRRLGILDQVKPKLKFFPGGGGVMTSVAKGEIEVALGPYINDMDPADLNILGPMPAQISDPTEVFAYVSTRAKNPAAAKALVEHLTSREAAEVYKATGMELAY